MLLKGVTQTIQNEAKKQNGGFVSMLLGTLGESLLENVLAGKGMNRVGEGVIRAGNGVATKKQGRRIVRAGHKNKMNS